MSEPAPWHSFLATIDLSHRIADFLDLAHGRGCYRGAFPEEEVSDTAAAYGAMSFGKLEAEYERAHPLVEAALPWLPRQVTTHGGVSAASASLVVLTLGFGCLNLARMTANIDETVRCVTNIAFRRPCDEKHRAITLDDVRDHWGAVRKALRDEMPPLDIRRLQVEIEEEYRIDRDHSPAADAGSKAAQDQADRPKEYLMNWRSILDALARNNTEEERNCVSRLNEKYDGPIIAPSQGGQPKVERSKLLEWWNHLEIVWITEARGLSAQVTLQNQYPHGREGTVFPDISGHGKKRRRPDGQ